MKSQTLSVSDKIGFGVGDLGGNLFFTAMGFWSLYFLTDVVGLSAGLAGMAVMVGKLWDAVTDPLMGFISDHTRTRWGRRRPWLLFGSLPLLGSMWLFFTAPGIDSQLMLALWATGALCLLNTAYTVVNIPYSSLTPDLTTDYHERTSLNGYRFMFAVVGTMLGAAFVGPIVGYFGANEAMGFSVAGLFMGLVMAGSSLVTFSSVREPALPPKVKGDFGAFIRSFASVFRNRPFVVILATYALHLTALTFLQTMLPYFYKYVFRAEAQTSLAMIVLLLVAMANIPLSVLVSKRIGKKRTYQLSFLVMVVTCLGIWLFGRALGPQGFLALMVLGGVGIGFGYVSPFAMVPDTIDHHRRATQDQNEGAHYGLWTFFAKVGTSLAVASTGWFLALGRFVAERAGEAPVAQTPGTLDIMTLVMGPLPALVFTAAFVVVGLYPLEGRRSGGSEAGEAPRG